MTNDQAGVSAETLTVLRRLRVQYRDRPAVYRDLQLITLMVALLDGSADVTKLAGPGTRARSLELTPAQAAARLGVTPHAVRKACRTGRLAADKPAGSREWRITPAALATYVSKDH